MAALVLLRSSRSRPLVIRWLVLVAVAALLTTATKLYFIGCGVGSPELNFTGISGHALFAGAVYPLLLGTLATSVWPAPRWVGVVLGSRSAVLFSASGVVGGAHSAPEVFTGGLPCASASAVFSLFFD